MGGQKVTPMRHDRYTRLVTGWGQLDGPKAPREGRQGAELKRTPRYTRDALFHGAPPSTEQGTPGREAFSCDAADK